MTPTQEAVATPPQAAALGAATLPEAFQRCVEEFGDGPALRTLDRSLELSWRQAAERVVRIAAGLAALGVSRGDTVGIMLTNRPEFHLIDSAALHLGATPFSVYNTSAPEQIAYVLGNAENRVMFVERQFADQVRAADVPLLEQLVVIDGGEEGELDLDGLEASGEAEFDFDAAWRAVAPDDIAVLIYTSGTTGPPKGVELTHTNLIASWRNCGQVLPLRAGGRIISYLPAAHLGDRYVSHYASLLSGAEITCVADIAQIPKALIDVRPTFFGAVPRIWEKLHTALRARGATGEEDPEAAAALRAEIGLDRVDWCFSGGAPIAPEVLEELIALGLPLSEVWGMSETSALSSANPPHAVKVGTVGPPLPGLEVRIADDGELLVRGPGVMRGYRKDPARTAEALDADGWLHTGDVAEIDADGYLKIIDRKKELIINSAGKNMSPANIERALKGASPLIGQAMAIGDRRPYNVALLVLDPDAAAAWGVERARQDCTPAVLASDPELLAEVDEAVAEANAHLSRVEQIKRFELLPDEWTPDSEELTPTSKLKRRAVLTRYAEQIDALYGGDR